MTTCLYIPYVCRTAVYQVTREQCTSMTHHILLHYGRLLYHHTYLSKTYCIYQLPVVVASVYSTQTTTGDAHCPQYSYNVAAYRKLHTHQSYYVRVSLPALLVQSKTYHYHHYDCCPCLKGQKVDTLERRPCIDIKFW